MLKNKLNKRVISSSLHKDFAVFSKSMINDYLLSKEQVNKAIHVDGKLIKETSTKIVNTTGKAKYQVYTIPLLVKDSSNTEEIVTTANSDAVYLSNQSASFSDEALLYLLHLGGHSKNVFLFIVFYLLNEEILEFRTDSLVKNHYMEFCKATGYKTSSSAMGEAIKKLSEMRLIINVGHNCYMMNPVVLGFKNNVVRAKAFTLYVNKLNEQRKNIEDYLLPQIALLKK
jgi:hypothetical protein